MTTKRMCLCGLTAGMLCVLSPLAIPLSGAVPITLATLYVYMAGLLLGARDGCIAVGIYVLLGAVGLPVFSGYMGGIGVISGVTGGFLIGYLPCAWLTGLGRGKNTARKILWMLLGTAVLYMVGIFWYHIAADVGYAAALASCVLPFIAGDAVKIIAACIITKSMQKWEGRME